MYPGIFHKRRIITRNRDFDASVEQRTYPFEDLVERLVSDVRPWTDGHTDSLITYRLHQLRAIGCVHSMVHTFSSGTTNGVHDLVHVFDRIRFAYVAMRCQAEAICSRADIDFFEERRRTLVFV